MSLGKRLRSEREKRKWSQKEVAEKVGITNTVLSNYERDYRDPDTETLTRLADLYDVEVDYLLGREKQKSVSNTSENKLTEKDKKDIAKRMEKIKKDLIEANADGDGLNFYGEPMSEEAIESLLEAVEYAVRQTQRINKKYIPKKYRRDNNEE